MEKKINDIGIVMYAKSAEDGNKCFKFESNILLYTAEAEDFAFVFSNNRENLMKYAFACAVDNIEKTTAFDDSYIQKVHDNIFKRNKFTKCLEYPILVINTDTYEVRSLDVDGNEIDDNAIYFQVDGANSFKKIDNKLEQYDEYVKKYNVNTK